MLRSRRVYIGAGVSALFLVLLLRQVDGGELRDALADAQLEWLPLAAAPYFAGLWLRAVRWRLVLRPSLSISTTDAYALLLVGYAANNVLPARAGELVRAGLLQQRHGATWSLGLGTIVVERVLDGLVLAAMLAATVALAGGSTLLKATALIAGAGFVVATLLIAVLIASPAGGASLGTRLLRLAPASLRPRLLLWTGGFLGGLTTLRGARIWAGVITVTTASWLCEGLAYWVIGRAFGLDLPLPLYAGVLAASNLALVAPSTAGGIGPFEFFAREAAVAYGATAAAGTAYAIALHALTLVPVVLLGLAVLWRRHLGLRTLIGTDAAESADDGHATVGAAR